MNVINDPHGAPDVSGDEVALRIALGIADVGVLELSRTGALRLRGAAPAHFGLTSDASQGLETVLGVLSEADGAYIAACIAAWKGGEAAHGDITVQVTSRAPTQDRANRAARLRLRVVNEASALLIVSTRVPEGQTNLLRAASHALRSPLNALLGWVHVLTLKRPDDAEVAGISARLERSARALLRTVNDLQDLDHLKRGKFKVEMRPLQLCDAIEAAVLALSEGAAQRQVEVVARGVRDSDTSLEGDPNRLRQLFEHLLRNAVHHSDPRSQVEIVCVRQDDTLIVDVVDHGSGLAAAQIETLFHATSREPTLDSAGLGAGLLLSREIVERHGGSLTAESGGAGQGVAVRVSLPARGRDGQKKAG